MKLAFLGTVHDPEGKNINLFMECNKYLNKIYDYIFLTISDKTSKEYIKLIKEANYNIKIIPKKGAANARREVVKFGVNNEEVDYYHYCDFDRVLVWIKNNLDELRSLKRYIADCEFLIIGRTEKAFLSHPIAWRETERLTNKVFSEYVGRSVDITGGSCAFSKKVAKLIHKYSKEKVTDGEWPIIAYKFNMKLDYIEVNGLEYLEDNNRANINLSTAEVLIVRIGLCNKIAQSIKDTWDLM